LGKKEPALSIGRQGLSGKYIRERRKSNKSFSRSYFNPIDIYQIRNRLKRIKRKT
jgi:hypothetical protein